MYRRTALGIALALTAALAVHPPGAQAQQTEQVPTEQELVDRIEALAPLLEEAREEAMAAEARHAAALASARNAPTLDTIQVGPLTVVTVPEQVELAREMYGGIWDREYAPFIDHSDALEDVMFTFQWSNNLASIRMEGDHYRAEGTTWRGRGHHEGLIRESIGRAVSQDMEGTQLHNWVRDALRSPENWDWVYRKLAVTPSQATRRCVEGEPGACWSALGIDVGPDAWREWYSPEERRILVRSQYRYSSFRRENEARVDACLDDGVLEQCDAIMEEAFQWWSENSGYYLRSIAPLGWDERITLVWTAVKLGGDGAWDRLVENPEMTVTEALEYASGMPKNELETAWRAEVMAHAPDTYADLAKTKWTALFWILLFGALAMRSTRWRLG